MWGRTSPTLSSRFLEEIPTRLLSYAGSLTRTPSTSVSARPSFDRSLTTWDRDAGVEQAEGPEYVPAVGDTVKHVAFGEGEVVKCEEWGNDYEVSVCFAGGELRRLLLSYAGLEKV